MRREQVALCAAGWCGTREGSERHKAILERYNSLRPLPRGYRMNMKDAWCAAFVSSVAAEAGVEARYPVECSCLKMMEKAMTMGIWQERDDFVPRAADLVLYNWQAQGTGDDTGVPDHVGMVLAVKDGILHVVEGNYDDSVKLREIPVDHSNIRGFVTPVFEETEVYRTLEEIPEYGRETIAKLVRDGSLQGIGRDNLGMSAELLRTLVILDRRGKL